MVQNSAQDRRPRGRPRKVDPAVALTRAIEVFWREGFDGADYSKLSRFMQMNKPSIYSFFGDKNSLFLRAVQHYAGTIAAEPGKKMMEESSLHRRLEVFYSELLNNMASHVHPRGCLMISVASVTAETHPQLRDFLHSAIDQAELFFAGVLLQACRNGELPRDYPVDQQAKFWVDSIHTIAVRARAGASSSALRDTADRFTAAILKKE